MKVVMVTNGSLFHQAYLSSCFSRIPGVTYHCIVSTPIEHSSQKMRLSAELDFNFSIIVASKSKELWDYSRKLIQEADICIVGAENHAILEGIDRVYFRYSEHLFKTRFWYLNPRTYLRFPKMRLLYGREAKNSWLLCASSHAKFDFNFYGLYRDRCLKFGYFPQANAGRKIVNKNFPQSKDDELKIVFAGRSIDWKHPEIAFYATEKLESLGVNCSLTFVSLPNKLRDRICHKYRRLISSGKVEIIDELAPKDLMDIFADSHLFIFPSDNGEGFGATLYEAMSSEMAVIANKKAGATDLLVRDYDNGFVYKNKKQLDSILEAIASNPTSLKRVAEQAKHFIDEDYNAIKAANNLVNFVKSGYKETYRPIEPVSKV